MDEKFAFDWNGYGGVWTRFDSQTAELKIGICPHCEQRCGHDLHSFSGSTPSTSSKWVEYTVSDGHSVIVQGIKHEPTARLMSKAPELYRQLRKVADADPMEDDYEGWRRCLHCGAEPDSFPGQTEFVPHERNCLWRSTVELLSSLDKPLRVWGHHDMTVGEEDGDQA